MGVTGLWTVVAPTARPTKLETLNRKRLAVDASIWIYQFLKAVRDKEGNALRNSHVVGFFRRICKLLYFGIKPVFVFDGGAPILKRETIRSRARRREGRRDDATRTAGKLLAVQVARAAEEESKRRRTEAERQEVDEELPPDQELVYVDEIGMNKQQRQAGRGFKKTDQYHLPDLDVSLAEMGAPNDPRVMSQAELEEYARQFHSGEDINLYDFSKIDFDSPFFLSLPPGDRYNILNAARLRSRLRMGYSKEQLDGMFPDRMAFSRFQIERVKERNELTQRLMNINGMNENDWNQGGRIAGERGKEYVLVKNDGVEGGWALGVVSNRKGARKDNAIDLDEEQVSDENIESSEEEDDFEDVAIEGLNRLPSSWRRKKRELREVDYDISYEDAAERIARKRKAVYDARKKDGERRRVISAHNKPADDGLFVEQEKKTASDDDDLFEDVEIPVREEEDDELQKAIAMSLENQDDEGGFIIGNEVRGRDSARDEGGDDSDTDDFNLGAALAESQTTRYKSKTAVRPNSPDKPKITENKFSGPLPFESLNLGQSLLGKKKAKKIEESLSGGFDRDAGQDAFRKKRPAQPVPDWFDAAPGTDAMKENLEESDGSDDHITYGPEDVIQRETIRRQPEMEVIDLDSEEEIPSQTLPANEVHEEEDEDWDGDDSKQSKLEEEATRLALEEDAVRQARDADLAKEREQRYELARQIAAENEDSQMEDVAQHTRAESTPKSEAPNSKISHQPVAEDEIQQISNEADYVEWSDSDDGTSAKSSIVGSPVPKDLTNGTMSAERELVLDDEADGLFEDVEVQAAPHKSATPIPKPVPISSDEVDIDQSMFIMEDGDEEDNDERRDKNSQMQGEQENYFSDSDEELMRQLAIETEEHARFALELNNKKTHAEAVRDYENELKQLRSQQKRDRRDADEVTQVMIQECQALLRLFGLPYITAPMEAEAQCAELVHLGLVDGIVTDDSDIFLFGGTRIYKNMFNAAKFVECYLAADLEKEYALDRKKLIRFAHLLGSDYTEGIPGIGPVTALEIISDFGTLDDFKEWCKRVQLGNQASLENQLTTAFRRKFKNTVQKKLFLPTSFPDQRVDQAYLNPEVDANPEEFQWGVPDLDKLRSFLMATIGWSQDRTDEILVPVIRDMNKRGVEGTQANITRFFAGGVGIGAAPASTRAKGEGTNEGAAPRNRTGKESGRMKNAYTRLRGEAEKRKIVAAVDDAETPPDDDGAEDVLEEDQQPATATSKRSRKQKSSSPGSMNNHARDYDNDNHEDAGNETDDDFKPKSKTRSNGAAPTKRRKTKKNVL